MAQKEFHVGSLCALLRYDNGERRKGVSQQLPCKIVGVSKKDARKAEDVELTLQLGALGEKDKDNPSAGQKWEEGNSLTVKGSDVLVLHRGGEQEGPPVNQVSDWSLEILDMHRDGKVDADSGWASMVLLAKDLGVTHSTLDRVCDFLYGDGKFSVENAWRAWLWVCSDFYWSGDPESVYIYTTEEVAIKKGDIVVDRIEVENEAVKAARMRRKLEISKEARQRLVSLMMKRQTTVLSSMNDREIQSIAQKCSVLQVEKGDELVHQGKTGDCMYIVIAGELDGVLTYGEGAGIIRKRVLVATAGVSFGEESLLGLPARVTVVATKSCELGVATQRNSEFIVQQSPDIVKAIKATAEGIHQPVIDMLMRRPSPFFDLLGDSEVKYCARNMKIHRVKKDRELYQQGGVGDSLFFVIDGFVRLYCNLERDKHGVSHELEVDVLKEGTVFEEEGLVLKAPRFARAVALGASVIGEIRRTDIHTVLSNPKYANVPGEIERLSEGHTHLSAVADALMRDAPSAFFSLISPKERGRLARGAVRTEFEEGEVLQEVNKVCFSVYVIIDGELEVTGSDLKTGTHKVLGTLTRGHCFGEFCVVACAKGQTRVRATKPTSVIDLSMEVCEGLILSRPDLVEDLHDIKLIFRRRQIHVELQAFNIKEILVIFERENAKVVEDHSIGKECPYFSRWSTGETMEVIEISPPLFGALPSIRGRYERSSIKLAETSFTTLYVGYDTEWGQRVAWNEVDLKRLSTTVRMQFLQEVETTLMLTNEQPSWLRYSMVEDRHGNLKMMHHWELSQARKTRELEEGFTPRSQPMGDSIGHVGMKESEWEAITQVAGWRTSKPWLDAEKPSDWDVDAIDDRFLSLQQRWEKHNRKERVFHSPSIVKCYNHWDNEERNTMVFITEIIEPTSGGGESRESSMSGVAKRGFTCLQLGNYIPSGLARREKLVHSQIKEPQTPKPATDGIEPF